MRSIAIFVALRYWNTQSSIIPRTRIRHILAILFASLELAGWTAALILIFGRH